MKNHLVIALIVAVTIVLSGCASTIESKPGKITLEDALGSVGAGLVIMKQKQIDQNHGKDFVTGLVPSEAEVTFNINAAGSQDGKLFVELSPIPAVPVGAGGSFGTSYTATRGNQITIKFKNLLFSKTTTDKGVVTVEGVTDPKQFKAIVDTLKDLGWAVPMR